MKLIVGGGLAGLIAAHAWPQAAVIESAPGPVESHKALLRFRTDAVARLTGIEFRKVRVRKGIWGDGQFVAPSIRVANLYAQKVLNSARLADRSIWNIDPVDRFIAPESLYEQLVDTVGKRIEWNQRADFKQLSRIGQPYVSTAPLPTVMGVLDPEPCLSPSFERQPITVKRWRLRGSDVFQTVYFPDGDTSMYRASITKDLLIAEFACRPASVDLYVDLLGSAFGIDLGDWEPLPDVEQRYGKIEPIPDDVRKRILFWLTQKHHLYSLGRFATWRNILLDDIVDDIAVIKRINRNSTGYDLRRHTA
jgi:hypothetical protein